MNILPIDIINILLENCDLLHMNILLDKLIFQGIRSPKIYNKINIQDYKRDHKDSIKLFQKEGYWRDIGLQLIPLNKIPYENRDQLRYNMNLQSIRSSSKIEPIRLVYEDNKYFIDDGNHRSFCCNELGYTHIPAIVEFKNFKHP